MNASVKEAPVVSKRTTCGICEASCGLVVEVRGDEVLSIRPDAQHPSSAGFACSKGTQFHHVRNDPDRVTQPLRRAANGELEPISWDQALDEIGSRLRAVIKNNGTQSVGVYLGNPIVWNYAAFATALGVAAALKTKHTFLAASLDINNYYVVNQLLYGNNFLTLFPDVARTQFMLILGSNPVVSHGSMMTVGHVREALQDVVRRRGRVVVVDPRRTETAELFEHVPIRPDADAWLLAAMIRLLFEEGLVAQNTIASRVNGLPFLKELVDVATLKRASVETRIPADRIAQLARDFVAATSASCYCRWGSSLGQFSTLTKYLVDALNLVTGNFDRPGGVVCGHSMIDIEKLMKDTGQVGYDRWRSRVEGVPEVAGSAPIATMSAEIETPGEGQLKALLVSHGNPAASGPGGRRLEKALGGLDLLVSMDPYLTETSRLAHYVLPPTLWIEREGFPIFTMSHTAVPYAQWSEAVVPPPPGVRDDWWILDQICRRIDIVPSPFAVVRALGKVGIRFSPQTLVDAFLRLGPMGDWFGLRPKGFNRAKLVRDGAGVKLHDHPPTGVLGKRLETHDHKVHLEHSVIHDEMQRLASRPTVDAAYPLFIISVRELRSHNTWLHNIPKLMAGDRFQRLRVHPTDARAHDIRSGDRVRVESAYGAIEVMAWVSDEVMPGTVGLPHGWGHRGGWKRAVAAGGACFNDLTSDAAGQSDRPSGQPQLTGVPVRIIGLGRSESNEPQATEESPCRS
ncbi:molybdopterin-dependent oxidoreductase [Hydrocarboniphaga sp.]|uniref:molybdopterin-dependent oxidoreductase n=1 Tax=Hydrocarboniphaga sp. TaxID=2033016 RepID=UPI003D1288B0